MPPNSTRMPTGCARNAAFSAFSAIPTRRPSPRSACTPCSIAARRRRASSPSTARGSIPNAAWAWSENPSPRPRPSNACPATAPSAMSAIRPRAKPSSAMSSRLFAELDSGGFAVAHNGNLTNALTLRRELIRAGAIYQSTSDTEVMLHLVARSRKHSVIDRFIEALRQIEGAYALVAMTNKKLIGARDPLGIRPLVLGELDGHYILASETCALDIIGARFIRDVENGEIVVISDEGLESVRPFPPQPTRPCIFEYIYFARPDSIVHGRPVYDVRKEMGARAGARKPHRCRRRRAGARFRRARRDRLRPGLRHSVRARHHPQPLCRPHLHPADAVRARTRRAAETSAPIARSSPASASCCSTIPSCAARPRSRSCR